MKPPRLYCALGIAVLSALFPAHVACAVEHAAGWPSFQGLHGDGTSHETGLLRERPKDDPPVVWRAKIGQGWGQPAILSDSVFICWAENVSGGEAVACLDAKDGSERWRCASAPSPY